MWDTSCSQYMRMECRTGNFRPVVTSLICFQEVEDSCYKAYMDMISKAERFIYIQNLYFISSTGSDTPKNRIALAILRRYTNTWCINEANSLFRVRRAIQNNESFRVVILVSVYPAGEIDLPSTRMLIGWTMKTICRGGKSILELLQVISTYYFNLGSYISLGWVPWQRYWGICVILLLEELAVP